MDILKILRLAALAIIFKAILLAVLTIIKLIEVFERITGPRTPPARPLYSSGDDPGPQHEEKLASGKHQSPS